MKSKTPFIDEAKELTEKAMIILNFVNMDDEQERQILGTFLFGVINGLAFELKENPINVQGVMIEMLINELKYGPTQAVDFCQHLIDSTDGENNPTVFSIIQRGISGYYELVEEKNDDFKSNFNEILQLIKEC